MAQYDATTAYYNTGYQQFYLDVMVNRGLPKESDDQIFMIVEAYQYRPDMLALDLYQQPKLWWVFYQRNPNTLTAPPWDFTAGKQIYLPKLSTLRNVLGL